MLDRKNQPYQRPDDEQTMVGMAPESQWDEDVSQPPTRQMPAYPVDQGDFAPDSEEDIYEQAGETLSYAPLGDGDVPMEGAPVQAYDAVPVPPVRHSRREKREPHSIFRPNVGKPNFVVSVLVNVVRVLCLLVVLAGVALVGIVAGIAKGYVETAPTLDLAALDEQNQTSFIYDANGNLITEFKGTENRVMVSIGAMPKYLQDAFVAVEDARFYTHAGVDLKRIVGAFVSNLSSSATQGGSTITQQLIKQTLLSSELSYKRKIQEAYLAMQLERTYSKEEILECYLNTIYLGENYYGVQVAAQGYFGKSLEQLTLRECAMLAGTTNSPYYYNPRRNFYTRSKEGVDYPAVTNHRTDYVLRCMYENQYITYEQYQAALDPATAHVLAQAPSEGKGMYAYPHYVEYAISECVDIMLKLNHLDNTAANRNAMESKLRTGGYRIMLALDTGVQQTVEDTLANWNKYPSLRDPADKVYRARNADGTYEEIIQPQAAAVVLDYHTGELKAIVGSRTVPTVKRTLNRAVNMKMPVGSSIKPIAVYAPALELGASPASVVYNMPLPISGWRGSDGKDTWPKNYGGGGYTGSVTLREAMKKSLNTAAAQTLMTMVGVNNSVAFLEAMGVDREHIDATPFGVTLGSSGITPLQMTVAFGVMANGGVYQEPISVLGISDSEGRVVWDGHANQQRRRVLSDSTAFMIVDMLKTAVSSGTGTSAKIKGQTVGGKTGTNSDQKGVFFAGMTGYYASSIWVGHDNYKALASKTTGSSSAAPIWQSYMSKIHQGLGNKDILEGNYSDYHLTRATTCTVSGQLAGDACRAAGTTTTDYWSVSTVPTVTCQMHVTANLCAQTGLMANTTCPISVSGVVQIPVGHPLYQFLGTEYEETLRQYLGSNVAGSGNVCPVDHGAGGQGGSSSEFVGGANQLLSQARNMLATMDASTVQYMNVLNAVNSLQAIVDAGAPDQNALIGAMGILTQAMAGIW